MNSDIEGTTTVEMKLSGRVATVEDVQDMLDRLRADGIPDTFEVTVWQRDERIHEEGIPYRDQKVEHTFTMRAERAARSRPV